MAKILSISMSEILFELIEEAKKESKEASRSVFIGELIRIGLAYLSQGKPPEEP